VVISGGTQKTTTTDATPRWVTQPLGITLPPVLTNTRFLRAVDNDKRYKRYKRFELRSIASPRRGHFDDRRTAGHAGGVHGIRVSGRLRGDELREFKPAIGSC